MAGGGYARRPVPFDFEHSFGLQPRPVRQPFPFFNARLIWWVSSLLRRTVVASGSAAAAWIGLGCGSPLVPLRDVALDWPSRLIRVSLLGRCWLLWWREAASWSRSVFGPGRMQAFLCRGLPGLQALTVFCSRRYAALVWPCRLGCRDTLPVPLALSPCSTLPDAGGPGAAYPGGHQACHRVALAPCAVASPGISWAL